MPNLLTKFFVLREWVVFVRTTTCCSDTTSFLPDNNHACFGAPCAFCAAGGAAERWPAFVLHARQHHLLALCTRCPKSERCFRSPGLADPCVGWQGPPIHLRHPNLLAKRPAFVRFMRLRTCRLPALSYTTSPYATRFFFSHYLRIFHTIFLILFFNFYTFSLLCTEDTELVFNWHPESSSSRPRIGRHVL